MSVENYSTLIIGSDIESLKAAYDLAVIGHRVILVEEGRELAPSLLKMETLPSGVKSVHAFHPLLMAVYNHPNIDIVTLSKVDEVHHSKFGFTAIIRQEPSFIESSVCCFCGKCRDICPVDINGGKKPLYYLSTLGIPRTFFIDKREDPPCKKACPLGINIQGYLALISKGKFVEALELVRESTPLAGVLGRICTHPCENECRRGEVDEPVSICRSKRFISDYEMRVKKPSYSKLKIHRIYKEKIAIIGSGPAGLTAAWELARAGYSSTIFEAMSSPGGMLRTAITEFRLPKDVLNEEIKAITDLGVKIVTDTPIGKKKPIESMFEEGFDAVLITTGAYLNKKFGISGEELHGVQSCIPFLRKVNVGKKPRVGNITAVFGGGNSAMETARTILRLGAKEVHVFCWRPPEEIEADPYEIAMAVEEGIEIHYLTSPIAFMGTNGVLKKVICVKMRLGSLGPDGFHQPLPIQGSEFEKDIDMAVIAIGQEPDLSFLSKDSPISVSKRSTIYVNDAYHTEQKGVFAAGDVVTGASTIVQAMGAAKKAAFSIHRFLRGEKWEEGMEDKSIKEPIPSIDPETRKVPRNEVPMLKTEERIHNFNEVELGFTKEQAVAEANRCINCGICSGCRLCESACGEVNAISHSSMVKYMECNFQSLISPKKVDEKFLGRLPPERIFCEEELEESITDLDDAVFLGAGLAGRVAAFLASKMRVVPKVKRKSFHFKKGIKIGVFLCTCNETIGNKEILGELLKFSSSFDDVVCARIVNSACHPQGGEEIIKIINEKKLTRVFLGSCVCCSLDMICTACNDQRLRLKRNLFSIYGLNPSIFEMVNFKNFFNTRSSPVSSVVLDSAKELLEAALVRARSLKKLPSELTQLEKTVAVVGADLTACHAANELERMGHHVFLIDEEVKRENIPEKTWNKIAINKITYHSGAEIISISGFMGNFCIDLKDGKSTKIIVSSILFSNEVALANIPFLGNLSKKAFSHLPLPGFQSFYLWSTGIPGIFQIVIPDKPDFSKKNLPGEAAAAQVSALMGKMKIREKNIVAWVTKELCRGCGNCEEICPFAGVEIETDEMGRKYAQVIPVHCQGCGACLSVCPTGAIEILHKTTKHIDDIIKVIMK
ncbi:MAG: FAD-dependent oxidoreductase [Thermodesulfobacteriota bacterium]|nr:FAD-dependent oxidoreductase [Thermodesulfobacteriota bacterium]